MKITVIKKAEFVKTVRAACPFIVEGSVGGGTQK
jgi:hypothetical protein